MRINKRAGGITLRPDPRKDTSADRSVKPTKNNLAGKPPTNPAGALNLPRPVSRLKSQAQRQSSGLTPRTVAELEADVRLPVPPGYRAPTGFKDSRARVFQLKRELGRPSNVGPSLYNQSVDKGALLSNAEDEQVHLMGTAHKSPSSTKHHEPKVDIQGSEERAHHHDRFQIAHGGSINSFQRMGAVEGKQPHSIMKNKRIYPDHEHVMQLDPRNLVSQRPGGFGSNPSNPAEPRNPVYSINRQESPPHSKTNIFSNTEATQTHNEERGFRIKTKAGSNSNNGYGQRKPEAGGSLEGHQTQPFSLYNTYEASAEPRLSSKEPVREEEVFEAFSSTQDEFMRDFEAYLPRIKSDKLRRCTLSNRDEMEASFFQPTWVRMWSKKKVCGKHVLESQTQGFLVYQLDNSHFKSRRMLISHLSTESFEDFEKALQQTVKHIFSADTCTEIFIQFKHIMEEDKLVLPNELKEACKTAGFRWRMMVNSANGTRLTVFEAKRNNELYPLPKDLLCHEPIKQSAVSVLSNLQVQDERSLLSSERQHRGRILTQVVPFDRIFMTFAALMKYLPKGVQSAPAEHIRSMGRLGELINIARQHPEFNFAGVDIHHLESNADLAKRQQSVFEAAAQLGDHSAQILSLKEIQSDSKVVCATYKSAMRLEQISDGIVSSMPYRYIRTKYEQRLLLPKTFAPVYIIPTMEEDTKLFIVQFSSERSKRFALADLVAVMEQKTENEGGTLWFPQFRIDSGLLLDSETAKQLQTLPQPPKTVASRTLLEVGTGSDKSMLRYKEQEGDIIIKGEFVAGLVSVDLLATFKIPLFMTLISKSNFIDL